jgi:ferrous iron transport protein B
VISILNGMRLSDLKTGEEGIITQVRGRGAFRRRIMEMGLIKGIKIKVIKNAPLKDPIEYSLMDYRLSLRRSEADLIEVGDNSNLLFRKISRGAKEVLSDKQLSISKSKSINVAFVGNPNAGKTSIFNVASNSNEHTGNYSGVTIDSKTAQVVYNGYLLNITDLPGTYSISAFSPEELFVRNFIIDEIPDVVVNVVDVSNLERNLYLTTQLIDMDIKVVIALNMYDELEKRQDKLDYNLLGKLLGIPIIPTIGSKGWGVSELFQEIINVSNDQDPVQRHIHINYGEEIEHSIYAIQSIIKRPENYELTDRISSRLIAIKLCENDKSIERYIKNLSYFNLIISASGKERQRIQNLFNEDATSVITEEKYGFISGALKETYFKSTLNRPQLNDILDSVLTHKALGFPFFIIFMWIMFSATFNLGAYPKTWIENGVAALSGMIDGVMSEGSLKDLLINGIIGGVGGVIVFLPNILILFLFISFMEDSGYMARAVFIMDKLMHKIGLHGKSFIPLIMGFGCNVPAIMATRTIEDKGNKLLTILINPFMSCSARLPVYLLLIGAIFPNHQGTLLFLLYFIGIILAIIVALIFKYTHFRTEGTPFVMELPPYRMPTIRSTLRHMWFKGSQYLNKMGGVILIASILLWALGYFPRELNPAVYKDHNITIDNNSVKTSDILQKDLGDNKNEYEYLRLEHSYIGRLGRFIEPAIEPLGFDWKMGVSLISGIAAKEIVVTTLGVLHQNDEDSDDPNKAINEKLQNDVHTTGKYIGKKVYTPLATFSYLLFILIYFPCIAVFAAVKKESGNVWWAVFIVLYTTSLAYLISLAFYQLGMAFIS